MERRADPGLSVRLRPAAAAGPLRALLEQPMGAAWRLATRFGDLPGALARLGEDAMTVALEQDGRPLACGVRAVKPVWWRGAPARLGYLALLRRDPAIGRIAGLRALPAVYAALAALRRDDELPFDLSAILDGNVAAQRLLTRGLSGLPAYRPRSRYRTAVWSPRALPRRGAVRPATAADLPALAVLAAPPPWAALWPRPAWDEAALAGLLVAERRGRIAACGRIDDQRGVRDTVLAGMPAAPLRPLLNCWRGLRRLPAIPPLGAALPLRQVDRWFWDDPDAALDVLAGLSGDGLLAAGWPEDHPDAAILAAAPHEAILATWYAVGGPDEAPAGGWHLEAGTL